MITITVTLDGAARDITIDPNSLTLGFLMDVEEAQSTGKYTPLFRAYGAALGFTNTELRALRMTDFRAIAEAIQTSQQDAATVPNASAPASESP